MSREADIFAEALDVAHSERSAFLARACNGDTALRAQLERLLVNAEAANGFLAAPLSVRAIAAGEETPGSAIGRYTLLETIGEGGCGTVWRAEQREPVRRDVALKVIKLGMDTREVIARFEAERQALALMDHPNIARVFDGGATASGRPYFVMELVQGVPITRFCAEHALTLRQRIELFIAVCEAVQHAHQKGIIHRDLKPSNILVSGAASLATPKVIDFGIAKATQGRLTDATLHTAVHQFIGTPAYMSPEQAALGNADVDTRSDIYSLGVLLYELLTGETPLDRGTLANSTYDQIREKIRTVDPARPSMRVRARETSSTAESPKRLPGGSAAFAQLRGDLDWIVMRCLEKDRARRYESAAALAADLERHLRDEPVSARPPSAAYTLQKLVRRHQLAFAAAAALATVLVLGAVVSTWQAVRATRAEREQGRLRLAERAQRQRAEAQELATRRRAYAADMNLAQQALALENLGRARELLDRHRPKPGEPDLRGWEWRHLWQLCRGDLATILCHQSAGVFFLSASADGRWVLVHDQADVDTPGTLGIWNVETRTRTEIPTDGQFFRAIFSPREPLVAIALAPGWQRGGILRIWNAATHKIVREWPMPAAWIRHFFSVDGSTLLGIVRPNRREPEPAQAPLNSARDASPHGLLERTRPSPRATHAECEIQRWRVADGTHLGTTAFPVNLTPGRLMSGHALSLSRDGRLMACGDTAGVIHLIDLETGQKIWARKAAAGSIAATHFSPDGDTLLWSSGNVGTGVHLWETASGREIRRFAGHRSYVTALQFWPDGKTFASAGTDQTIRLWDAHTGALLRTLRGHQRSVYSLVLLPDNRTLVSGAKDGAVHLWNIGSRPADAAHIVLAEPCLSWAYAPDGRSVLTLYADGTLRRRHGPEFRGAVDVMNLPSTGLLARALFADDSPHVAVPTPDGRIEVWDWAKRGLVSELRSVGGMASPVAFLGAGTRLLVLDKDARDAGTGLREWDLAGRRELRAWPEATGLMWTVSADKRWCIVLDWNGSAKRIDLPSGSLARAKLEVVQPWKVAFAPDGERFVVASLQNYARLWDRATFSPSKTIAGFIVGVRSAVFSPDGWRLATGSAGAETMRLWDVETWEPLLTLESDDASFSNTAFSPDGNILGSRAESGTLHLWRAPSHAEIEAAEKEGRWR